MDKKGEKKDSNKLKLMIAVLIFLIIVGIGSFIGYNLFLKNKLGTQTTNKQQAQQTQVIQNGQTTQTATQQVVSSKTYELSKNDILVNLADDDGKRYLKVNVYLGYDSKKLDSELEEKQPIIMDAVISTLRTKKAADISAKGLETIKAELVQKINPLLQKGQINNIYFSNVLVQ